MITLYIIISVVIGIIDLMRLYKQQKYFDYVPMGDLEFYEPKSILGIHNIVFLPSLIIIFLSIGISKIINR